MTHSMQQAARVSQKTAFFHLGTWWNMMIRKRSSKTRRISERKTTSRAVRLSKARGGPCGHDHRNAIADDLRAAHARRCRPAENKRGVVRGGNETLFGALLLSRPRRAKVFASNSAARCGSRRGDPSIARRRRFVSGKAKSWRRVLKWLFIRQRF